MENETHNQLLDMMDEGVINAEWLAQRCMAWLGEHELKNMVNHQPDFRELNLFGEEED